MPNQKIFDQLLIFVNLYKHTKNEAVSLICSEEMVDLKILQFCPIISGIRSFLNTGFVQEHSKYYKFSLQNRFREN